LDRIIESLD